MNRLLKIEFKKLIPYPTTWILIGLHFFLAWLVISGLRNIITNIEIQGMEAGGLDLSKIPILHFPDIWHNITYVAGFFKIILAILVIISICNEFTYRTLRQNIIDGMSRSEFLLSKIFFIIFISLAATLFLLIIGVSIGFSHTPEIGDHSFLENSEFLLAYFVQILAYLVFALMLGFLIRRSGLAIALLLLYTVIIEPVIAYSLPDHIDPYLPLSVLNDLIQFPFTRYIGETVQATISFTGIAIALLYTILFAGFVSFLLKKMDL